MLFVPTADRVHFAKIEIARDMQGEATHETSLRTRLAAKGFRERDRRMRGSTVSR